MTTWPLLAGDPGTPVPITDRPLDVITALEREARDNPVVPLELAIKAHEGARKRKVITDKKQRTRALLMRLPPDAQRRAPEPLPDTLHRPQALARR